MKSFLGKMLPVSKNMFEDRSKSILNRIENLVNLISEKSSLASETDDKISTINQEISELKKICEQILVQQDKLQIQMNDLIKMNLNLES